jgi:hypothetical protein
MTWRAVAVIAFFSGLLVWNAIEEWTARRAPGQRKGTKGVGEKGGSNSRRAFGPEVHGFRSSENGNANGNAVKPTGERNENEQAQ